MSAIVKEERGAALVPYQPRRKSVVGATLSSEAGAALVTVLLFMMLTFILITSMLSVTGNEIVISGIQRDSTRALDLAQAGIEEAKMRIAEGRPFMTQPNWRSSIDRNEETDPNVTVKVIRNYVGTNSAYLEIQSDATVGRARRRLSALVLQRMISFPPNITFAASVIEQGSADINCGDAFARSFIQYKTDPNDVTPRCPSDPPGSPTITYAGWRVSKVGPVVGPCYTNAECAALGKPLWYPGQRRTEPANSTLGVDIAAQKNKCPAGGGGSLPGGTVPAGAIFANNNVATGTEPLYGFDTDDPDGGGPAIPQAVIPGVLVCSGTPEVCSSTSPLPCGLPYKWEQETFPDETGALVTRWFKSISFDQWFAAYWRFDETKMNYVKRNGSACTDAYCLAGGVEPNLASYPQLGAVPPFPEIDTVNANFQCRVNGGGVITSLPLTCNEPTGTTSDLGCKYPQMSCSPPEDRSVLTVFGLGDWTINANLKGHGTIVVDGNLTVNGDFEFWGTIVVNGTLTLGAGNATVHGGLVADSTLRISGNIKVEGGGTITNVPTGRSVVTGRGWWER